jgi:hypothetical protein
MNDHSNDFDLDALVLECAARFTVEEALARREAFNATVSDDEL